MLIKATVLALALLVFAAASGSLARTEAESSAGRCAEGKPPPTTINRIQSLVFQMIRSARFNNFNGRDVVRDVLKQWRLRCGAVMDTGNGTLITMRDIDEDVRTDDT